MSRFAIINKGNAPLAALTSPLEAVRQFTPNWFAVTMGTGILSLALAQLPGDIAALRTLGEALWLLNIGLFALFSVMYASRWLLFFDEARQVFGHSTVSMFFGTIPMGLATVISGLLVYGPARWGTAIVPLAEALWWLDVAMALACGVWRVDSVHDVYPSGTQYREDDRCLAVARGGSRSCSSLRRTADPAPRSR